MELRKKRGLKRPNVQRKLRKEQNNKNGTKCRRRKGETKIREETGTREKEDIDR